MYTPDAGSPAALRGYLTDLEAALDALPPDERREILLETRSHVLERAGRPLAAGAPSPEAGNVPDLHESAVRAVLMELGEPASYARRFLGEEAGIQHDAGAAAASTSRRASVVLHGLARLGDGGWPTLPLLLLVAAGYGLAGLFAVFFIAELVDPAGTGLMIGRTANGLRYIHLAVSGEPDPQGDVLGVWFAPLVLLLAIAIHLGIRAVLRRTLRRPS